MDWQETESVPWDMRLDLVKMAMTRAAHLSFRKTLQKQTDILERLSIFIYTLCFLFVDTTTTENNKLPGIS